MEADGCVAVTGASLKHNESEITPQQWPGQLNVENIPPVRQVHTCVRKKKKHLTISRLKSLVNKKYQIYSIPRCLMEIAIWHEQ